jgi:hypothetical protein
VDHRWLPFLLLMLVFALSRMAGIVAAEFQRAYALAFCAGCISPERWPGGCRWARCLPRTSAECIFLP